MKKLMRKFIINVKKKFIINVMVLVVSATGMSEATAPEREFYHKVYGDIGVDIAMIIGIIIGMLF